MGGAFEHKRTGVLRTPEPEIKAIEEELSLRDKAFERRGVRYPYHVQEGIEARIDQPAGSTLRCRVKPRNLSSGGICFLHSNYVHSGTACMILLKTLKGEKVLVPGTIAWCKHARGVVHDVGVKFDDEIDVGQFLTRYAASAERAGSDAGYDPGQVAALARELQTLAEASEPLERLLAQLDHLAQILHAPTPGSVASQTASGEESR